jgi:hypothetical protein
MIRVSLAFALQEMERENLNTWILLDGARELSRNDDKGCPIGPSIASLRDCAESMSGDTLTIKATKAGGTKAISRIFFVNLSQPYSVSARGGNGIGATPWGAPASVYQELADLKLKLGILEIVKPLQDKILALESKDQDIGGWVDRLTPVLQPYADKFFGVERAAVHLTGAPVDAEEVTRRTNEALRLLFTADADALLVLEKIAKLASSNPATYNQYKPMILAM